MIIHDVTQGSDQWAALRRKHPTASEAPVMMGASSKMKRNELLKLKATGSEREVSDWVQKNLFDKGHEYEASARKIVEEMIGDELYPITATDDDAWLLASYDGMNMMQDTCFEHKMWNEELAECVRKKELDPEYYWQLEQQLLISKADRVIFTVSDGTPEKFVSMEYTPVPGRAVELIRGWRQFAIDLESYVHVEEKPAAAAEAIKNLPALVVQVSGEVKQSNLVLYKATALAFIENIKTDLQTDEDFAQADATVKFCADAEERLDLVKSQALSQTESIDELFRSIDELKGAMRTKRLQLDKLVKARKESIRVEIKTEAEEKLRAHLAALGKRIARVTMPTIAADFITVMKGKKTVTSLRDAADTELARAKIAANAIADDIDANLKLIDELAPAHAFLFADLQQLVTKSSDDLRNIIKIRISEHEAAEQLRINAAAEKLAADRLRDAQLLEERSSPAATTGEVIQASATPAARFDLGDNSTTVTHSSAGVSVQRHAAPMSLAASGSVQRPSAEMIIATVAKAYSVNDATARQWLKELQLNLAAA